MFRGGLTLDSHLQVTQYIAAAAFPTNAAKAGGAPGAAEGAEGQQHLQGPGRLCQANLSQEEAIKLSKVGIACSYQPLLTAEAKIDVCSITIPPQALL